MSKKLYPHTDINDLVEQDLNHEEEFFKGRGPDKQKRKARGTGSADHTDHEMVNEYVEKYKMKHPEGLGHKEAHSWMSGSGMKPHEVDHAMSKIKTRKS